MINEILSLLKESHQEMKENPSDFVLGFSCGLEAALDIIQKECRAIIDAIESP